MADPIAPPAGPQGEVKKAERWAGKHKVALGVGGVGAAFLLLSRRGSGVIQGEAVAATDESGVDMGSTEDDTPLNEDPPIPEEPAPTPEAPPPAEAPQTPPPAPRIAPPPAAPPPAPAPPPAKPTVTTAPTPTQPQAPHVTMRDVPGYYTVLQVVRDNGHVQDWHHYTSGTRKGDVVYSGHDYGVAWGWPWRSTPQGWSVSTGIVGGSRYQRIIGQVQYEVTHEAATNTP